MNPSARPWRVSDALDGNPDPPELFGCGQVDQRPQGTDTRRDASDGIAEIQNQLLCLGVQLEKTQDLSNMPPGNTHETR